MMENSEDQQSCLFPSSGLFASAGQLIDQDQPESVQQTWLTNESFKKDVNFANKIKDQKGLSVVEKDLDDKSRNDDDDDDDLRKEHKKRKHKKEKKKKSKKARTQSPVDRKEKEHKSKDERSTFEIRKKNDEDIKIVKNLASSDNQFFKIDTKLLKDNLMYDSLYAGDVPKYKVNDFKSKIRHQNKQRYFKVKLNDCPYELNKRPTKFKSQSHLNEDYIQLISDEKLSLIKPIVDKDNESNCLTDEINYENKHLYARTKEFNQYLNQNSADIDKWIEFIQYQDEVMFNLNENEDQIRDGQSNKKINDLYVAEKKLLIIEKALKLNPSSIRLKILKLEIQHKIIEAKELVDEWSKLYFNNPTNFNVIIGYMKFITTHLIYFNVENLDKFFINYMNKIVQYQEGHLKSVRNEIENLEKSMLEILLIYTTLLKQCGYIEKAISIWQALIEFNFNKPDLLLNNDEQTSLDDCKEYFEIFWSSGEPRFGEKSSIGWKNVLSRGSATAVSGKELIDSDKLNLLNEKEDEVLLNSNDDLSKIWFGIELIREQYNWQSGKPYEDNDLADSDHIILFEHISPYLFRFKDAKSYLDCLFYFLCFLNAIDRQMQSTIDLPNFFLENEEIFLCPTINNNSTKSCQLFTSKYFSHNQELTFIHSVYLQSINLVEKRNLDDHHLFVDQYMNFLVQHAKQFDKDKLRKLFKQQLKKPSNCGEIRLWRRFVDLEVQLNEKTSAKTIFNKMQRMLIEQQQQQQSNTGQLNCYLLNDSLRLINDFIEFSLCIRNIKCISLDMIDELRIDDEENEKEIGEEILIFIYSLINSRTYETINELTTTASLQLRVKQKINDQFDECFEQLHNHSTAATALDDSQKNQLINNLIYLIQIKIYTNYFHKLFDQSSIQALEQTEKLINQQLIKLKSISSTELSNNLVEKLYEKHLDLYLVYLKYNFNRLKSFNKLLGDAIEHFPKNRYFLTLLINTEKFNFVNRQISRFTIKLCRQIHESTLEQWLFVIYSEIRRLVNIQQIPITEFVISLNCGNEIQQQAKTIDHTGIYSIGLASRIRNLFDRALQVYDCLLLWRFYLHFEINQKNLDKAKIIFHLAVEHCPWSKLLYMDGIKLFAMIQQQTSSKQSLSTKQRNSDFKQSVRENLDSVLDLMNEKKLRIRTNIEEVKFLVDNQQKILDNQGTSKEL